MRCVRRKRGDEKGTGDAAPRLFAKAAPFVAHAKDSITQLLPVDVLAIEKGAVDRYVRIAVEESAKVSVTDGYTRKTSHSGLNGLRIENICGIAGSEDSLNAKPVCGADNCTEISGVLYAVEREIQLVRF